MKCKLFFSVILLLLTNCGGPSSPGSQCSGGKTVCFDFQGINYALDGVPGNGSSSFYRLRGINGPVALNIDIPSNTPTVASYNINSLSNFYIVKDGIYYTGASGSIDIISVHDNLIFGDFAINVQYNGSGAEIPVSNGIIDGIACP